MSVNNKQGLAPYSVLDLTDDRGQLCSKIFADLGADVIKIEPPEGDPARRIGPFINNEIDPNNSLFWMAYNTGKKGVSLNIKSEQGKKIFRQLVKNVDFVIESFTPGYMKELDLDYYELEKLNPKLIMASITPFGQTGPRSQWKGPDIIPWAMGGYMWMSGEPGKAPLRVSLPPQAYLHASAMTAVGCLMALHYRNKTGKGQYVDTSAQQCPSWMLTNTYAYWDLMKQNLERAGVLRHFGHIKIKTVWRAKDGYISFMFSGGAIGAKGQSHLVELMDRDGMAEYWLKEIDWNALDALSVTQEDIDRITEAFGRFFETKTKAWLLKEAVNGGIMLAPINTVADVLTDPQLEAREFWSEVNHPKIGLNLKYPGAPVKMSETQWQVKNCAPFIGEHNSEVFMKLGYSATDISKFKELGVI